MVIIGVHTPETKDEADLDNVRKKVEGNGMKYPIAVDNSQRMWRAYSNQWWPAVYLIDKQGLLRYRWDGELKWKGAKGDEIMREKIEELLDDEP